MQHLNQGLHLSSIEDRPSRSVIPITPVPAEGGVALVPLYQAHQKIYPRSVQGVFAQWRWLTVIITQVVFYGLPWLEWGQRQAVLFDLDGTLSRPGAIDFLRLRARLAMPPSHPDCCAATRQRPWRESSGYSGSRSDGMLRPLMASDCNADSMLMASDDL